MLALIRDGQHDPPVALREVAEPEPGPDQALVEVRASSLNRGELALLSARPDGWRPGQDIAGVVTEAASTTGHRAGRNRGDGAFRLGVGSDVPGVGASVGAGRRPGDPCRGRARPPDRQRGAGCSRRTRYKGSRAAACASVWTFADHNSVDPTNNHAERALRGAVIYRKLSLGSQSDGGERRIERLLSAHTTCRLQRRSLHAYLIGAITAHTRGDPAPLLA
jgi:hypothetical protein